RSEGHSQAEFALACVATGHEDHRHVYASDQQNQTDHCRQNPERLGQRILQIYDPPRRCKVKLRTLLAWRGGSSPVCDLMKSRADLRDSALLSNSRREPGNHHQTPPLRLPVQTDSAPHRFAPGLQVWVGLKWNPNLCRITSLDSSEAALRDADNRQRRPP